MDVLVIDGKNYVKAGVIARDLGYTADYVGQLCRQGKVDAKLFGRSWYVDKDSIGGHKSTRYRSTQAKSVQALKIETETPKAQKVHISTTPVNPLFYGHSTLKASPRYTPDESELIPTMGIVEKKSGNLKVELADATQVDIVSKDDSFTFNTPKLPHIQFKGKLAVTEFSLSDSLIEEGGMLLHPKEVAILKSEKKAHIKDSSAVQIEKEDTLEGSKVIPVDLHPEVTHVAFLHDSTVPATSKTSYTSVLVATVSSFVTVFILLGLETHISATPSTLSTQYVFEIENVLASVYSSQTLLMLQNTK